MIANLGAAMAALMIAAIVAGLLVVVRINGWSATTLPPDWQHIRARWAAFHTLRTFLSVGAVAAAVGTALTARIVPSRVTEQPIPARRVPT